ncbi:MAG: sugar transferase [Opitutales bacterium]
MHTTTSTLEYALPKATCPEKRDHLESRVWSFALAGDIVFTFGSLFIATILMTSFSPVATVAVGSALMQSVLPVLVFGTITMVVLQMFSGLYSRDALFKRRRVAGTLNNVATWLVLMGSLTLLLQTEPPISLQFVLLGTAILGATLTGWRWWFANMLHRHQACEDVRKNVAVVGWNDQVAKLYQSFREGEAANYNIVACLPVSDPDVEMPVDVARLKSHDDLERLLQAHRIDSVLVADPSMSADDKMSLQQLCGREFVEFMAIPEMLGVLPSGLRMDVVAGVPMIVGDQLPLEDPTNRAIKRAFDVVFGTIGLICAAPIIALFAAIVYKESPGPVFFRQTRLGKSGKLFSIIKIRSMKLNADKLGSWSTKNDNRRLKIGSLMRKLNIDELPQFWNVIRGEMSIVGPRPELPENISNFKHEIRHYNMRHFVKPGITGWAQINGWRGDTCLTKRVEHDLAYMERWNPWFDAYIMARTLNANKNAY